MKIDSSSKMQSAFFDVTLFNIVAGDREAMEGVGNTNS